MSQVTFAANSRYRVYDLDLPLHIPSFGVGFAISRQKDRRLEQAPAGAAGQGQGR